MDVSATHTSEGVLATVRYVLKRSMMVETGGGQWYVILVSDC